MRYFSLVFLATFTFIFAQDPSLTCQKRIKNHLIIRDHTRALEEIKIFLAQHPQSKGLHELMIRTLSQSGRGLDAYQFYLKAKQLFPVLENDYQLIETFCWAILDQSLHAGHYSTSMASLIGVSLTHDAKAVKILEKTLQSSNPYLRMLSVKMASSYGDEILKRKLIELYQKEEVFYVKEELISAFGRLKMETTVPLLQQILEDRKSTASEKALGAQSLIMIEDQLSRSKLEILIKSPRQGLRFFAAEALGYFGNKLDAELLLPLLTDPSSDVKIAALNALTVCGFNDKEKVELQLESLLKDPLEDVVIAAAKLLTFCNVDKAIDILEGLIYSHDTSIKLQASVALSSASPKARERAFNLLSSSIDPYVNLNIATTLLGYEKDQGRLCEEIAIFLSTHKEKIAPSHGKNRNLQYIGKSFLGHHPGIPHYPLAIDQQTRLSLLNQLAIFRYSETENFIKKYLKESSFGITFAASKTLMEEGSLESATTIKALLLDPDEKVQIQAALVLALMGKDEEATRVLEKAFDKVDKEIKITICEALGHLGSRSSIPFLLSVLEGSSSMMRVIAASSIIQCIYH